MSVNAATIKSLQLPVAGRRGKRFEYLLTRAFGCWHLHIGRPTTDAGQTYRACLDCGARRRFNTETWMMNGPYYFK